MSTPVIIIRFVGCSIRSQAESTPDKLCLVAICFFHHLLEWLAKQCARRGHKCPVSPEVYSKAPEWAEFGCFGSRRRLCYDFSSMEVNITEIGEVVVAAPVGEIDGQTAPLFEEALLPLAQPAARVLLDMSGVS